MLTFDQEVMLCCRHFWDFDWFLHTMIPFIEYVSEVVIMAIEYTRIHNYIAEIDLRAISYGTTFSTPASGCQPMYRV
jgi:hypothetical protein